MAFTLRQNSQAFFSNDEKTLTFFLEDLKASGPYVYIQDLKYDRSKLLQTPVYVDSRINKKSGSTERRYHLNSYTVDEVVDAGSARIVIYKPAHGSSPVWDFDLHMIIRK
jgi:hypothetical protein